VLVRRASDNGFTGGGSVDLNQGPAVEQEKLDQILTHVRNQERERERENKVIKKLLETHNHEIKSW
jgi:hypothetical protein